MQCENTNANSKYNIHCSSNSFSVTNKAQKKQQNTCDDCNNICILYNNNE